MFLKSTAKYFDRTFFDVFYRNTGMWVSRGLKGQVKKADQFIEIWNRPTRKRQIHTAMGQPLEQSAVVRVEASGEIFMVGTVKVDVHSNYGYRQVAGLHKVTGVAVVTRRLPAGPPEDPGWAVSSTIATTFGDIELRSVIENQDVQFDNYGNMFLFLPHDVVLLRHDSVSIVGKDYFVLEPYADSGLQCARVTEEKDVRINFQISRKGEPVYDDATSSTTYPDRVTLNVTGKIEPMRDADTPNSDISNTDIKVMVKRGWMPFAPMLQDEVLWRGQVFTVVSIDEDAASEEWVMRAQR